jgi:hypothetical protein
MSWSRGGRSEPQPAAASAVVPDDAAEPDLI